MAYAPAHKWKQTNRNYNEIKNGGLIHPLTLYYSGEWRFLT